jgi:glycosyltransferase involved in cell wall biosynthesis
MGLKQGLDQVVGAARLSIGSSRPVLFVLMGDGSQRSLLQAQAAGIPNISFVGLQPIETYADVLAAADVLLVSERASVVDMSLPSKLAAYFAAGRPVVAAVSPIGATATEVIRSGGGLVVSAGDPVALLSTLEQLRCDPSLEARLGASGRAYANERLGKREALGRIQELLRAIAGGTPAVREIVRTA